MDCLQCQLLYGSAESARLIKLACVRLRAGKIRTKYMNQRLRPKAGYRRD